MRKKFKRGELVFVNGIGKNENEVYRNKLGKVILFDDFFCDYNVEFSLHKDDWFKEYELMKLKKHLERK